MGSGIGHPAALGGYLLIVNLITWLAFRRDKRRSETRDWRTPEKRLLTLAIIGGWPAAKLAQRWLRHKTRKQPFAWQLNLIGIAWGWALAFLAIAALLARP
ncbi:DUF1294 domain-containing protein [Pelagivirga sediminicola]|uniref:DUF1294 domain-containing protein n=1 Tax=Pelagivirga sediminicola TaxID=2170575 RepID=A0A2T7G664_9RHOB|nr:DUF1294 domain-containing protein [Pelagivirga sediminicola]PVA09908.1 DUF1294 domain-containing protein [Pelagivirga sediminicola]